MAMRFARAMRPLAAGPGRRPMGGGPTTTHVTSGDLKKVVQDMPPAGGYPDCNLERNAAKKEKREARMAIVPHLQAEEGARVAPS
ncbi:hypothetical protein JL720_5214 [Aureococcus anophagefferens]|nr:hypothetical protein JL720_5214 [Aureococcus anophagefferens]